MNRSANPPTASATQPLTAPTVNWISPRDGSMFGGTVVTVSGTGFTGASAVNFGATPAPSFTVHSDTYITAIAPAGIGAVPVTVTTPAGTSSQSVIYTYLNVPASLSSVSPSSGPTFGGNTVTLTGSRLTNVTAVMFGTTAATTFTVVSDTHISAVAPPGTGNVQVTVTSPGGTSNGIPYSYATAPTVTSVGPTQGPTFGGNTVTLTGSGLTNVTAVMFGTTAATAFTVVSPTQLTATAPAGGAGPVNVTVTTPGGTSALETTYFYVNTPTLTGISPASGPVAGGNTVTLTGTHFIEATAVMFGTTPAGSFTTVSDTQLTAAAPPGAAGPVQITVTTAGGTSNEMPYTYLTPPTLTALSPAQGPTSGGNIVTVTGISLAATTAVMFGTMPAAFSTISDSQLTATAPPGVAGPVNVTVATPGGTSPALNYTRIPPPTI